MKKLLLFIVLSGCGFKYRIEWGSKECIAYCEKHTNIPSQRILAGKDESGHCICEETNSK